MKALRSLWSGTCLCWSSLSSDVRYTFEAFHRSIRHFKRTAPSSTTIASCRKRFTSMIIRPVLSRKTLLAGEVLRTERALLNLDSNMLETYMLHSWPASMISYLAYQWTWNQQTTGQLITKVTGQSSLYLRFNGSYQLIFNLRCALVGWMIILP